MCLVLRSAEPQQKFNYSFARIQTPSRDARKESLTNEQQRGGATLQSNILFIKYFTNARNFKQIAKIKEKDT